MENTVHNPTANEETEKLNKEEHWSEIKLIIFYTQKEIS